MSILAPATRKVLEGVRPAGPLFANAFLAELFDIDHTRGELTLLPCTIGGYVLFDRAAAFGKGGLGHFPSLGAADKALEAAAAKRAP